MLTLNHALERLRRDLGDTDPATARWSNDDLARHLQHALAELSEWLPRELKTTLTTTAGSRDLDISALTPRLRIVAVEWQTGQYPPVYQRFSVWQDTLTLLVENAPAAAESVNVYWHGIHTLDPASTTLPPPLEETLLLGAKGYAQQEEAAGSVNRVNAGGTGVAAAYARAAAADLAQFRRELRRRGERGSLRTSTLYVPAAPVPAQDTDPGP